MEDLDTLVLRTALDWQQAGLPVVLVVVSRTWGSSPRPPGSLMAINGRGETVGSVSGGCIEDALIERIRDGGSRALTEAGRPQVLRYGISAEQAHQFGLPCGGTVELVLEPLGPQSGLAELCAASTARQGLRRVLALDTGAVQLQPVQRGEVGDGVPRLSDTHFTHYLGPAYRLLLIGAGDLARFMAQMALAMGFEVTVCDPRLEHRASWPGGLLPGVRLSAEMPDDLVLALKPDARTAVVALTHDPKLDDLALIEALQSEAFYVGAIGSRRNSEQRRARLAEHFGLSEAMLDRLHGPAGVYIGSKTPAEIALSIMAEVVACKNGVARTEGLPPVAAGKARAEARAEGETEGAPTDGLLPPACAR